MATLVEEPGESSGVKKRRRRSARREAAAAGLMPAPHGQSGGAAPSSVAGAEVPMALVPEPEPQPAANGAVRSIFPWLMSKAQASMTATGKPSASATTV